MIARLFLGIALLFPPLAAAESPPAPMAAEETRPLAVGTPAPDAAVRTLEGEETRLHQVIAGRPVALIFYRGGW